MDEGGLISVPKTTAVDVIEGSRFKYVETVAGGDCGGNFPCYLTVEAAAASEPIGPVNIFVEEGAYGGDVFLETPGEIALSGGWDGSFSGVASWSSFGSITIQGCTVEVEGLVIGDQ